MKNTIRHKIQFTGMVFILSLLLGFSGTDKVAGQQLIPPKKMQTPPKLAKREKHPLMKRHFVRFKYQK